MDKWINTLKNGSAKAKKVVISMIVFSVLAVVLLVSAIVVKQLLFFFGAVVCVFVVISLVQTLGVYEYENTLFDETPKTAVVVQQYFDENDDTSDLDELSLMNKQSAERKSKKSKKKSKKKLTKKSKVKSAKQKKEKVEKKKFSLKAFLNQDDDYDYDEEYAPIGKTDEDYIEQKLPEVTNVNDDVIEDELEKDINYLRNSVDENKESKEEVKEVIKQASDEEIASYNRKKIKKTLHKFKVKRDHRLVLVDRSEKFNIKQTPAYIWVSENEFNILLIEEEPRRIVLPLFGIKEIDYLKKQEVNADTDYPAFHKKNMFTDLFRPYLPDYTQSTVVTDLTSYKNLYGIGPDIYFTNRSAKNLMDLLNVEFRVDDKVTTSSKVNRFFKDAYKSGILLRDNVIDAVGYADQISKTLDDMAHSTISYNEFKDTLNLMMKNKIITQEFAMHYMDIREKIKR